MNPVLLADLEVITIAIQLISSNNFWIKAEPAIVVFNTVFKFNSFVKIIPTEFINKRISVHKLTATLAPNSYRTQLYPGQSNEHAVG
jgi:hypothetical protein